jgi:hypothetical protein
MCGRGIRLLGGSGRSLAPRFAVKPRCVYGQLPRAEAGCYSTEQSEEFFSGLTF